MYYVEKARVVGTNLYLDVQSILESINEDSIWCKTSAEDIREVLIELKRLDVFLLNQFHELRFKNCATQVDMFLVPVKCEILKNISYIVRFRDHLLIVFQNFFRLLISFFCTLPPVCCRCTNIKQLNCQSDIMFCNHAQHTL